MFAISSLEESESIFNEFLSIQEQIFTDLEICFRVLNMPTLELGASAYQKVDMEAWMPGRKSWGEVILFSH